MARYITTSLRFPPETYRELQYRAARRGKTLASLVRESVELYLRRGDEAVPFGDDPADVHVGSVTTPTGDESVNHDHYLYGWARIRAGGSCRRPPRARTAAAGQSRTKGGALRPRARSPSGATRRPFASA